MKNRYRYALMLMLMLALAGCAVLDAPVGCNTFVAATKTPDAIRGKITPTPLPSPLPTRSPSPSATRLSYGSLPITETAIALEQAVISNERARLQARETAQELDRQAANATATWTAPTETAIARATATSYAWVEITRMVWATETAMRRAAELDEAMARERAIRLAWMPWLFFSAMVALYALLFFVLAWLRAAYLAKMAERAVYEQSLEPRRVQVRLEREHGRMIDYSDLPIDFDTLREVSAMIVAGARYTQAQMTGAGKPLVKDGSFQAFGDWMVEQQIALRLADGRYQILRPDFFEQILAG